MLFMRALMTPLSPAVLECVKPFCLAQVVPTTGGYRLVRKAAVTVEAEAKAWMWREFVGKCYSHLGIMPFLNTTGLMSVQKAEQLDSEGS